MFWSGARDDGYPWEAHRSEESAVRPSMEILFLLLLQSNGTHLDAVEREKTSFRESGRVLTDHRPTSPFFLVLCLRNFLSPSSAVRASSSTSLNFRSKRLHLDDIPTRSMIHSCSGKLLESHVKLLQRALKAVKASTPTSRRRFRDRIPDGFRGSTPDPRNFPRWRRGQRTSPACGRSPGCFGKGGTSPSGRRSERKNCLRRSTSIPRD